MSLFSKKTSASLKSTVRAAGKIVAATQRFLPIAEIRSDTVLLKNGGLRAVILVEPVNFNLKSETEQQGIISGYEGFVNTLNFPVEIVVRSTKVNIDPYLEQIRTRAKDQKNDLLKQQTEAYANFVERIVEVADIMQKRFYVIVPLDDTPASGKRPSIFAQFFSWIGIDDSSGKASQRYRAFPEKSTKLKDRLLQVQSGLHTVGLPSRRLTTHELIELFYQIYNPKVSQEQKLKGNALKTEGMVL